jgi:sulfate adenylyltransferase
MMGIGFSPLTGFMGKADWHSVCEVHPDRRHLLAHPVMLATDDAGTLGRNGTVMATMKVTEVELRQRNL